MSCRPGSEPDDPFLREVFFEIRSPEFELAELSQRQLQELLGHQFQARSVQFAGVFPSAQYRVLTREGIDVGYELVLFGPEILLIDIAVRPRFQNQGIGTARMRGLLAEAAIEGKSVALSVEIFNPARRLFERLGFTEYEDSGIYKRMRWTYAAQRQSSISPLFGMTVPE